ncbi:hypothetical protein VOLCADRAFT_100314 [Volvox carteri f. nagariensis]|uniref:ribonuclease Z n=1 Tax=Volvox carteri f. nagariensis TaxID=3068 RepID=D8UJZ3_VOLCA|nr:uncharacterized protein VOLCADRAFT_100314 [Volvox carteri f. nagariensis]EFJ39949.1 hypothetical protein VOLCADRAFT_100314 [Volvox carteri f. nagariensis]|eukprot:XP_002958974.1 hypothetical protein VOLCADRAFT_100314 [Volvox carteri f. nagariensis]
MCYVAYGSGTWTEKVISEIKAVRLLVPRRPTDAQVRRITAAVTNDWRLDQYLINAPEGFARLVLEHRCRPGPGLRALFLTDLSQAAQGGLGGLLLRLRQDGHAALRLVGPAGLYDTVEGLSYFVRCTHPALELTTLTSAQQGCVYDDECLEVRPVWRNSLLWQVPPWLSTADLAPVSASGGGATGAQQRFRSSACNPANVTAAPEPFGGGGGDGVIGPEEGADGDSDWMLNARPRKRKRPRRRQGGGARLGEALGVAGAGAPQQRTAAEDGAEERPLPPRRRRRLYDSSGGGGDVAVTKNPGQLNSSSSSIPESGGDSSSDVSDGGGTRSDTEGDGDSDEGAAAAAAAALDRGRPAVAAAAAGAGGGRPHGSSKIRGDHLDLFSELDRLFMASGPAERRPAGVYGVARHGRAASGGGAAAARRSGRVLAAAVGGGGGGAAAAEAPPPPGPAATLTSKVALRSQVLERLRSAVTGHHLETRPTLPPQGVRRTAAAAAAAATPSSTVAARRVTLPGLQPPPPSSTRQPPPPVPQPPPQPSKATRPPDDNPLAYLLYLKHTRQAVLVVAAGDLGAVRSLAAHPVSKLLRRAPSGLLLAVTHVAAAEVTWQRRYRQLAERQLPGPHVWPKPAAIAATTAAAAAAVPPPPLAGLGHLGSARVTMRLNAVAPAIFPLPYELRVRQCAAAARRGVVNEDVGERGVDAVDRQLEDNIAAAAATAATATAAAAAAAVEPTTAAALREAVSNAGDKPTGPSSQPLHGQQQQLQPPPPALAEPEDPPQLQLVAEREEPREGTEPAATATTVKEEKKHECHQEAAAVLVHWWDDGPGDGGGGGGGRLGNDAAAAADLVPEQMLPAVAEVQRSLLLERRDTGLLQMLQRFLLNQQPPRQISSRDISPEDITRRRMDQSPSAASQQQQQQQVSQHHPAQHQLQLQQQEQQPHLQIERHQQHQNYQQQHDYQPAGPWANGGGGGCTAGGSSSGGGGLTAEEELAAAAAAYGTPEHTGGVMRPSYSYASYPENEPRALPPAAPPVFGWQCGSNVGGSNVGGGGDAVLHYLRRNSDVYGNRLHSPWPAASHGPHGAWTGQPIPLPYHHSQSANSYPYAAVQHQSQPNPGNPGWFPRHCLAANAAAAPSARVSYGMYGIMPPTGAAASPLPPPWIPPHHLSQPQQPGYGQTDGGGGGGGGGATVAGIIPTSPQQPLPPPSTNSSFAAAVTTAAASAAAPAVGQVSVLFLGTGSAEPSKYRGASAVLVRGLGPLTRGSLLIDAGEGAFGAMVRWLGPRGAVEAVSDLAVVWISHKHPDHCLGLPGLLEARGRAAAAAARAAVRKEAASAPPLLPPLLVVGPAEVGQWLSRSCYCCPPYGMIGSNGINRGGGSNGLGGDDVDGFLPELQMQQQQSRVAAPSGVNAAAAGPNGLQLAGRPQQRGMRHHCRHCGGGVLEGSGGAGGGDVAAQCELLGLFRWQSVAVHHCRDAWGLVLEHRDGWKLVYSVICAIPVVLPPPQPFMIAPGDTRPCPALIAAGRGATLLIHEATFEPCMESQARSKRHSTSAEAAAVAEAMGAYRTILTHFSQRYPRIPAGVNPAARPLHRRPLPAFDGMLLPLAALPELPYILPPLALAMAEPENATATATMAAGE